jgi:tRNA (mo5U34)-methyltransferase
MSDEALRAEIASVGVWYHVLELAPGVLTPGVYDMRPHLGRFGLAARFDGLRVLDVGAGNGFFAFHFERHGAARVVAVDLEHITDHDAPAWYLERRRRELGAAKLADLEHPRAARRLRGRAPRARLAGRARAVPAVELPDRLHERFDLVFCCNVLIHHRDPMALTEALARMLAPGGLLVLATTRRPDRRLELRGPARRPLARGLVGAEPPGTDRHLPPGRLRASRVDRRLPVPTTTEPDRAGIMGVVHARL